jgi:hypothetical protein
MLINREVDSRNQGGYGATAEGSAYVDLGERDPGQAKKKKKKKKGAMLPEEI